MSKSKYIMKGKLLNKKYEPFVEEFEQHDDDRLLVVNMLNQLLEACKAMESMDNVFVRVVRCGAGRSAGVSAPGGR